MSLQSLDVFELQDTVAEEPERFAVSCTRIHAQDICEQIAAINAGARSWPESLLQRHPSYRSDLTVEAMVTEGKLRPGCANIFCVVPGPGGARGNAAEFAELADRCIHVASGACDVLSMSVADGQLLTLPVPRGGPSVANLRAPHVGTYEHTP